MALPPFFDRVSNAIGGHLAVSRESLEKTLKDVTVGIRCEDLTSVSDRWIAELAANILARLYPRIAIVGSQSAADSLRALAADINPNVEITTSAPFETSVCVGPSTQVGSIHASSTGWVARVSQSGSINASNHPSNPYAAGAAAAMACAELFRRVFLHKGSERDVSVSLLDYTAQAGADMELAPGNLGDVLFVGVGAVGNATIWALSKDQHRQGHVWLIDPEDITMLNLQRYVLGKTTDVSRAKVKLGERELQASKLVTTKCKTTLEHYAKKNGGVSVPTICVSVDNVEGRRAAQALLPRLVINGWTGGDALGCSWHLFSNPVACLACLYHPHGQGVSATQQAAQALGLQPDRAAILWITRQPLSEEDLRNAASSLGAQLESLAPWRGKTLGELYTDVVCGAVPLDVLGLGKLEVVPLAHQSVLAGVLMAAELVKRTDEQLSSMSQAEPLVVWDDILSPPPSQWRRPRAREIGCICGDSDFQRAYAQKWAGDSS